MILAVALTLLTAGNPVRDTLAAGETKTFTVNVPAQSAVRLVVVQEGVDIGVTLRPSGSDLPEHGLDMVAGPSGEEVRYVAISGAPAVWNVFVRAVLPRAARGAFTISYEIKPAGDRERAIAATRQLYQQASDLDWKGTTATTQQMCEIVAAQAAANGDRELAAEATYQAARRHDVLGDVPGAIALQLRALDLFRALGRRDRESRALNRLGDYSRKTGETRAAEEYFDLALPLARESGDRASEADILNNSGLLLLTIGRPEEALVRLLHAVPLAQEIGSANVELALLANIGECHGRLGDNAEAVQWFERALARVRDSNLPARRLGRSLHRLATAHFANGEPAKAESMMADALQTLERAGDFAYFGEALSDRGRMYHAAGAQREAAETFARALPLAQKAKNVLAQSVVLSSWAETEIARGDLDSALSKLDEAIGLSRNAAAPSQEAWSLYLRASALDRKNDLDAATASIESAVAILEEMREKIVRSDLRASYLASVRRYYDLLIDLQQRRGRTEAAFAAAERARARTFLESLAESRSKIRKGVDAALLRRERDLRAEINAKDSYRARATSQKSIDDAAAAVEKLIDELREVERRIRNESPAYAALQKSEPASLGDIRRHLVDDSTVLVSYHLGERRSYAWVVDRRAITVHELAPASRIGKAAREYHELIARERSSLTAAERRAHDRSVDAAARRVAELAWKPFASRVRAPRVLVSADGALHYVPFGALPLASGKPLIAAHEIVQLPSASVGVAMRRTRREQTKRMAAAVFADPVFSRDDARVSGGVPAAAPAAGRGGPFARLRFSREEAGAITRAIGESAFEALDFAASKKTLAERNLRQYRLLHFATHGYIDTEHPELSSLVLSLVDANGRPIDGRLRLHEIYNLDLDADLVVLSACRTALGKEIHGEGLVGLMRGFMYAGTPRVVATTWNVDDRATAELMSRFYRAMLDDGLTAAAALRAAQLSMLREPRWSNPHDWAAFALHGDR